MRAEDRLLMLFLAAFSIVLNAAAIALVLWAFYADRCDRRHCWGT